MWNSSQSINGTCYLEFRKDQLAFLLPVRLEMAVVLFVVPLIITSYCYSRLVWILGRGGSHRRQRRVAGLVAATLLNFLVCFGPYNMSHVVGYICGVSPAWRTYVMLLSTLNSCVDPFVFYFSSSRFQADFHELLRRLCGLWGQWQQESSVELNEQKGGEGKREDRPAEGKSSEHSLGSGTGGQVACAKS